MRFLAALSCLTLLAFSSPAISSQGGDSNNGEGEAAYGLWHNPFRNDPPIYLRRRRPPGDDLTGDDVVAHLRVDQAWGSAQLSAALYALRATAVGFMDPEPRPKGSAVPV